MPSLAGLFGRKNKTPSKQPALETDSTLSSPTAEYVTAEKSLPSSPNGRSLHPDAAYSSVYPSLASNPNGPTNSSKLRLPFSRRKQSAAASTTSIASTAHDSVFSSPPRPSFLTPRNSTSDSEADHRRLRPPPSKSAIFAAYADPHNSLSTRSLPNEPSRPVLGSDPPPVPPKKPGFFNWSKSAPKAPSPPSPTDSSFNLKSFRHVGPSSPLPTPGLSPSPSNLSPASAGLNTAIPRPRGTSTASNSDSSQRISVAAFREAQARRSTAGSPVPSLRSPSPGPGYTPLYAGTRPSASHAISAPAVPHRRTSGLAYADSDDEDESEDDDDHDDDDDERQRTIRAKGKQAPIQNAGIGRRKRTLTKKPPMSPVGGRATKSEIGHGTRDRDISSGTRAQSTHILMSQYPGSSNRDEQDGRVYDRAHSSLGFNNGSQRPRASASASAITPSAAAKRASVLAAANNNNSTNTNNSASAPAPKRHSRAISDHSVPVPTPTSASPTHPSPRPTQVSQQHRRATSASSSSSSEDDAPLATLVPPRRPGSSLSTSSNTSNPHARQKPLIDINELTKGRPARPMPNDDGFIGGRTLLGGRMSESPPSLSIPLGSPGLGGPAKSPVQVSMSPPTRFVSPPASPKMKADTMGSITTGTILAEKDRNGLGERLNRVVQLRTGSSGTGASLGSSGSSSGSSGSGSGTGLGLSLPLLPPKPSRSVTMPAPTTSVSTPTTPSKARTGSVGTTAIGNTGDNSKANPPAIQPLKLSPPEEDLAAMLGAGIHLIRRTGDSESEEEDEEEDSSSEDEDEKREREEKPITPIPIKQRAPPPAFSVTSRPPLKTPSTASMAMSTTSGGGESVSASGSGSPSGSGTSAQRQRQRSSTLVPPSSKPVGILNIPGKETERERERGKEKERTNPPPPTTRQRSSTLLPGSVSATSLSPIPSTSTGTSSTGTLGSGSGSAGLGANRMSGMPNLTAMAAMPPNRPFATGRRESPAGSSTGDSSSGRSPFTPRDGSDVGAASGSVSGSGSSGLGVGGRHIKRRSVSFEDDLQNLQHGVKGGKGPERGRASAAGGSGGGAQVDSKDGEVKRKERRRSEAKAAIELGYVINGRGPLVSDNEDDLPINQTLPNAQARVSALNPMMGGFGPGIPGWNMNMNMGMGMLPNPGMLSAAQFMPQPPHPGADAAYMAAHQQAMMYAKQAYQMAVAQQAMAAAGDEWERGSTYGGGSASVYGGRSPSVAGSSFGMSPMMGMGMGMNGMNMGMPMGMNPMGMGIGMPGNGWSTGSVMFPGPAGSVYGGGGGISGTRSEYGGGGTGGQWSSSKSSYGDYGSSNRSSKMMGGRSGRQRDSMQLPPMPPIPQQKGNAASGRGGASGSGPGSAPRARTASQPASPTRGARRAPPPSSWKASGV